MITVSREIIQMLTEEEQQYVTTLPKLNLFKDIIGSLNSKSGNIIDEGPENERQYVPFIVNKNFSFGIDTILYANELNFYNGLDKKLQYDFYYYGLDKKKRYNAWKKKEDINNLEIIKEYFECSNIKAGQYAKILTDDEVARITSYLDTRDTAKSKT